MCSIVTTQTFSFRRRSRKKHYSSSTLDGRETLEEGLGLSKGEAECPARPDSLDAQSVAHKLDTTILFYSLGPKKILVMGSHPSSHSSFPAPGAVGHRNPGPELSKRHPEIERPTARLQTRLPEISMTRSCCLPRKWFPKVHGY